MRGNRFINLFSKLNASGGPPPLVPYLGQVATRCYQPDVSNLVNKQLRGRSAHVARDAITLLTLIFPNYFVDGFGAGATYQELGVGGVSTITASIEYPLGTLAAQVFAVPGTILDKNVLLATVNVNIAKGDWYFVRYFITNPAGVVFCLGGVGQAGLAGNVPGNYALGDVLDSAPSGLTDNSNNLGIPYTATSGTSRYSPIVMAGQTVLPSFYLLDDSKGYGENDTGDGSGDIGEVQRWISPYFANSSFCIRGRDAAQFNANSTIQVSLAQYFSHLLSQDGVNCLIHGMDAATTAANTDALAAKFPTLKRFLTTILPVATSTDGYASLGNQTTAAYNPVRVVENPRRRALPAAWNGVFDSAAALESSQDSGLVAVNVSTSRNYFGAATSVHPQRSGYAAVREKNRALAVSVINRNGVPLSFANQVFADQTDYGTDETDLATYTFAAAKPNGFLIGAASPNKLTFFSTYARLGTAAANALSATVNGSIACTKVAERKDTTGGALSLHTLWVAPGVPNDTCTFSVTYDTVMLRCGADVWSAVGDVSLPTVGTSQVGSNAGVAVTLAALNVPARGAAIVFASTVNGTAPALTPTNFVPVTAINQVGTGTMFAVSGGMNQPGSKAFTATFAAGSATTAIAVAINP